MAKQEIWIVPDAPPEPVISGLSYHLIEQCIHCGFCLQACPTYRQTGLEMASPRGRIALMRGVAEGQIGITETFAGAMNLCLGCRACETACPSGVQYGHLLEEARELVAETVPAPWYMRLVLKHLIPSVGRLKVLAALARLARPLGLFRLLPAQLRGLAGALPPLRRAKRYPAAAAPAVAGGTPVLFFHGCIQEAFLQGQNLAAVRVLTAAGAGVSVPNGQTCCGAMHAHYGDREGAKALARRNIALFEQYDGVIINHAGGCGAQLKEYGYLLKDDKAWAARAAAFSARVRDISEWLVEQGLPEERLQPLGLTVTYQDSCHLAHGQKVRGQPRSLIRQVPGVTYTELPAADQCCGSAGIYNILQPEMAGRVLADKMAKVESTGAGAIITANPGCYLQVRQGVRRRGLAERMEVLSLAELLDQSLNGKR